MVAILFGLFQYDALIDNWLQGEMFDNETGAESQEFVVVACLDTGQSE